MTIADALQGINAYPIPLRTIVRVSVERGIEPNADFVDVGGDHRSYRLAKADLLLWLSVAPNISQGGQSYTFSPEQREDMRNEAENIYRELEPQNGNISTPTFGYKGDRL